MAHRAGVVVIVVAWVRTSHMVGRKRGQVASRAVHPVAKVRVMTVVVVVMRRSCQGLAFNLSSSFGQHGNVTTSVVVNCRGGQGKSRIRVRRRHIRWGQSRARGRANGLGSGRRRHHSIRKHMMGDALLVHLMLLLLVGLSSLVASPWVGVVVNARVTSELIRSRELLAATGELAGVRLLASVSSDVTSLVLQTMKGLITERALVGSGQLVGVLRRLATWKGSIGLNNCHCCCCHLDVALLGFLDFLFSRCCGV
jgi:hypothetical protein